MVSGLFAQDTIIDGQDVSVSINESMLNNFFQSIGDVAGEGFAKVLVEAMACGCKIISTNVDSAPLVLEDWGYMINPSESNEICESLNKIIKDCNYPFEKQQAVLKKFTWSTVRTAYSDTVFN